VRFVPGQASPPHSLDREEVLVVLDGALTARYADGGETVAAGGALIVSAGREFSLVADAGAEAVCVFPVGGTAQLGEERIVPPWAVRGVDHERAVDVERVAPDAVLHPVQMVGLRGQLVGQQRVQIGRDDVAHGEAVVAPAVDDLEMAGGELDELRGHRLAHQVDVGASDRATCSG
jgi:hypothetical protein